MTKQQNFIGAGFAGRKANRPRGNFRARQAAPVAVPCEARHEFAVAPRAGVTSLATVEFKASDGRSAISKNGMRWVVA